MWPHIVLNSFSLIELRLFMRLCRWVKIGGLDIWCGETSGRKSTRNRPSGHGRVDHLGSSIQRPSDGVRIGSAPHGRADAPHLGQVERSQSVLARGSHVLSLCAVATTTTRLQCTHKVKPIGMAHNRPTPYMPLGAITSHDGPIHHQAIARPTKGKPAPFQAMPTRKGGRGVARAERSKAAPASQPAHHQDAPTWHPPAPQDGPAPRRKDTAGKTGPSAPWHAPTLSRRPTTPHHATPPVGARTPRERPVPHGGGPSTDRHASPPWPSRSGRGSEAGGTRVSNRTGFWFPGFRHAVCYSRARIELKRKANTKN